MWPTAQSDLEKILSAKVYAALLADPVYQHFLAFAGLLPGPTNAVPPSLQKNLSTAAKMQAHIIAAEVEQTGALDEQTVEAKLLRGPLDLYRFWDSSAPGKRTGVWWLDRSVIDQCRRNTARSAKARKQWLREHLAVSIDWSKMDRIDQISLSQDQEVPAIVGIGKRMRVYSMDAVSTKMPVTPTQPPPMAKATLKEYWDNLGKYFPGGVRQTVLPFIPRADLMDLDSFLMST
jgi:hypothetical protein